MKTERNITLNLARQGIQASIPLTQHDAGTQRLVIRLRNGSEQVILDKNDKAVLYIDTDSYEHVDVFTEGDKYENCLVYDVTAFTTLNVGETVAVLQIYRDADRTLYSPKFAFMIDKDITQGTKVQRSPAYSAVIRAQLAAERYAKQAEDTSTQMQEKVDEKLDSKLDVIDRTSVYPEVYAKDNEGKQMMLEVSEDPMASIPMRNEQGLFMVGDVDSLSNDKVVVNKGYVDKETDQKVSKIQAPGGDQILYGSDGNMGGIQTFFILAETPLGNTVMMRHDDGTADVAYPNSPENISNKEYVDFAIQQLKNHAASHYIPILNPSSQGMFSHNGDLNVTDDLKANHVAAKTAAINSLTVLGEVTVERVEDLHVNKAHLVLNGDNVPLQIGTAGILIKTGQSLNKAYAIVFNPADNSVELGLGVLNDDDTFEFDLHENKPIATRVGSEELHTDGIMLWDSAENTLYNVDITPSDIYVEEKALQNMLEEVFK